MSRLVKCYGKDCIENDIKHPKEEMLQIAGKNYCKSCYDKTIKEREGRQKVYDYLADHYNLSMPTPLMMKHIKEFHEGYGWSYKKIYALLKYNYEILDIRADMKYGVRHLANNYDEAMRYYISAQKRRESNSNKINPKRTISIKDTFYGENTYKKSKIIDMEDI